MKACRYGALTGKSAANDTPVIATVAKNPIDTKFFIVRLSRP
jgi:hypothetical protein